MCDCNCTHQPIQPLSPERLERARIEFSYKRAMDAAKLETQDQLFSGIAIDIANSLSKCVSKKVAAVAVRDGNIVCVGVNGTAPGDENCCDHFNIDMSNLPVGHPDREAHSEWSNQYEGHAELNLVAKAAREGISLNGCTLYCTLQPCWGCSKYLKIAGIVRVVYTAKYDRVSKTDDKTLEYFEKRKIAVLYLQK